MTESNVSAREVEAGKAWFDENFNGCPDTETLVEGILRAAAKVRAIREGDGERPFTGSIPKHAKWCQPGDRQEKRMFIVRFDDQDRNDAVFEDEDEARKFYARATVSWNCYLFGALPAFPDAASPAATGAVKYQCREIGEGGWRDCTKVEYDLLQRDPHHDTREVPAPTGGEKE